MSATGQRADLGGEAECMGSWLKWQKQSGEDIDKMD
jgi:hypothetical protein